MPIESMTTITATQQTAIVWLAALGPQNTAPATQPTTAPPKCQLSPEARNLVSSCCRTKLLAGRYYWQRMVLVLVL